MKENRFTALYIRVSTDAQAEEGYSIEAQKDMLEGFCKSKQITNYKFYIDGGFSGSNILRPKLEQLIIDIKNKLVKSVVVYKLDRLSRSQKDTLYLIEDVLNPNGTEFISLNENLDTSTSIGRAMLGIMSAFAQLERETIKERTRMGMKKRVESGLWMGGGKIPFGFDYDSKTGKLTPNNDASTVRKIYKLYISGYSTNYIANTLCLKYDQLVIQILKRHLNYGAILYKGKLYENCHEPIIDKETYNLAMAEMKRRSKIKSPTSKYLLTGLLYCGVCGAKLRYQKWGNFSTKLVCYSQQKSKEYLIKNKDCDLPRFDSDKIEKLVLEDIFTLKPQSSAIKEKESIEYIDSLKYRKNQTEKGLKRLYELYSKSEDDILLKTIEEMKESLKQIEFKIETAKAEENKKSGNKSTLKNIENLKSIWDYISDKEKQLLIRSVINRVIVHKDKIEVIYNL